MRRHTSRVVTAGLAAVLGVLSIPHAASAQAITAVPNPPPYNPYPPLPGFTPPSILPLDINSEIARVRREVNTIFGRYMAEWNAMSPVPTQAGNPPILVPNGYDAQRILGGLLNFDEAISPFNNTACAFCHLPYTAFSGPIQSVNLTMVAYPGSYHYRAAKRTAQRYTYSHTFPVLNYNPTQEPVLRRKLLGWACDRVQAADSRRRTGTGPAGRSPGNGEPRYRLHRVQDIPVEVPTAVRAGVGRLVRYPVAGQHRGDLRHPQGAEIFQGSTTPVALSAVRPHEGNQYL